MILPSQGIWGRATRYRDMPKYPAHSNYTQHPTTPHGYRGIAPIGIPSVYAIAHQYQKHTSSKKDGAVGCGDIPLHAHVMCAPGIFPVLHVWPFLALCAWVVTYQQRAIHPPASVTLP